MKQTCYLLNIVSWIEVRSATHACFSLNLMPLRGSIIHCESHLLQKYYLCRKFNYVEMLCIRRSQSNDFKTIRS